MKNSVLIFLVIFIITSCVKDKPGTATQPQVQLTSAKKVYVINEGRFRDNGTGTISLYDPGNNSVIENVYEAQNNSQIGNIAQSLNYINGDYYIVVNNDNKVLVCTNQFKKKAQIGGLNSPRYILAVTNQKAYVSDLYANAVSIIDLNLNTKTGSIPCPGKTEKMILIYNKVFITNTDRDYVYVANTVTDLITDSVFVGKGAASILLDKQDRVWVLASGESSSPGRLTKIDPKTNATESAFVFASDELPGGLCANRSKDTLYFLNNSIYRMSISDASLPSGAFVQRGTKNFYGLGVNPNDFKVYASDALDYSQRSQIYIYNTDGSESYNFKAGVISNGFYFE